MARLLGRAPGLLPELGAGARRIPRASLEVIVDVPAELLRRRLYAEQDRRA